MVLASVFGLSSVAKAVLKYIYKGDIRISKIQFSGKMRDH